MVRSGEVSVRRMATSRSAMPDPGSVTGHRPARWWGRWTWERVVAWMVVAGLALASIGAGVVALRSLPDDAVGEVDAVVVLGGGRGERVALGRELADNLDVPLVLSAEAILWGWRAGLACEPPVRCELPEPNATRGEARMVAGLAQANGWDEVAVVTSRFHVGRTRMLMRQCLDDVAVVGASRQGRWYRVPWDYTREALGTVAGLTVQRAC